MPLVSVIIPNYNHEKFLQQRIDSVLNQTFQDFEVILLDDSSIDESLEILNKYENHPKVSHLIINKMNSCNPFKQWEKGIKLAKGDFIWIAESDDFAENCFLEENVPEEFESFLKLKKRGKIEGLEIYSGLSSKDIYTHTTIKMDVETYNKYLICIYSYTMNFDKNLEYHYSLRKFMNNIIFFIKKNESLIKEKYNICHQ